LIPPVVLVKRHSYYQVEVLMV